MCGIFLQVPRIIKAWQIERTAERRMAGKTAGVRKGSAAGGTSARQTRGSVRTGAFFRARFCRIIKGEKMRRRQAKRPTSALQGRKTDGRAAGQRDGESKWGRKDAGTDRGERSPRHPSFGKRCLRKRGGRTNFCRRADFTKLLQKLQKSDTTFCYSYGAGGKARPPHGRRQSAHSSSTFSYGTRRASARRVSYSGGGKALLAG